MVEGRAARRAELIRVGGVGDGRAGFCGIVESIVWYALHIRVFCRDRVDAAGDEHPESQDELCGSHPCVGLSCGIRTRQNQHDIRKDHGIRRPHGNPIEFNELLAPTFCAQGKHSAAYLRECGSIRILGLTKQQVCGRLRIEMGISPRRILSRG